MFTPAMAHPTRTRPRRLALSALLSVGAAALVAACTTTPAPIAPATAPSAVRDFRPADTAVAVAPDAIAYKALFETIGENGTIWYQHVQTLANPYFEGRADGTAGMERARDYVEWYFRRAGLEPAFAAPGAEPQGMGDAAEAAFTAFRQDFDFRARVRGANVTIERASVLLDGEALVVDTDFVVLGNSGSGDVTAPVTFVGYAIESGAEGYTSFDAPNELDGRIALVMRYEPLDENGKSLWAESRFSTYASIAAKMQALARRGVAGIILINPPGCADGATGLEKLDASRRFGPGLDVPVVQVTPEVAARLLEAGEPGRDLLAWRRLADQGLVTTAPLSETFEVTLGVALDRERAEGNRVQAQNVGAVLRGQGALASEWLVIGGHLDHNGYGWFGTDPEDGPLFPGADDNASGTAGVLVLADRLVSAYAESIASAEETGEPAPMRSIMFITFDAEERGLHGSRAFSENPSIAPERVTAMINMDMIGRLRSDELSVLGVGTAEGLEPILAGHFERSGLVVHTTAAGSGASDDANFHRIEVPAIHFFTGMHPEYTTPADKAYTVNPAGAAKVLDVIYDVAIDLATRPEKLTYVAVGRGGSGGGRDRDRGYAPVRLGILPDMSEQIERGILISGTTEGTAAADAGLREGDILLRWDDVELDGLHALVGRLRDRKPGDEVTITILREGAEMQVKVKLKAP